MEFDNEAKVSKEVICNLNSTLFAKQNDPGVHLP